MSNYTDFIKTGAVLGASTITTHFRSSWISLKNGTNANTLKCQVGSRYNGDNITETDNIAKGATTGNFTLSADGYNLKIEAAGLTGNAYYAMGMIFNNNSGTDLEVSFSAFVNDVALIVRTAGSTTPLDLTVLVDTGDMHFDFFYLTDE